MDDLLKDAQMCINHEFSQVKFLRTALTHSSYANEQETECEHNERLEFLGDAVLELVISAEAFRRYPDVHEGELTRVRSDLVKKQSLAAIARAIGVGKYIFLGRSEEGMDGRNRDSLLADVVEALFGAVYLDAGFDAVQTVILNLFQASWPDEARLRSWKDYKSSLQELTQGVFRALPTYHLDGVSGPDHEKIFKVTVTLPDGQQFTAEGTSLKRAEQIVARMALEGQGRTET